MNLLDVLKDDGVSIPTGYKWVAMDANGDVGAYKVVPIIDEELWNIPEDCDVSLAWVYLTTLKDVVEINWKESLCIVHGYDFTKPKDAIQAMLDGHTISAIVEQGQWTYNCNISYDDIDNLFVIVNKENGDPLITLANPANIKSWEIRKPKVKWIKNVVNSGFIYSEIVELDQEENPQSQNGVYWTKMED